MSPPANGGKPAQTGFVDMGYIGFYDSPGLTSSNPNASGGTPIFNLAWLESELANPNNNFSKSFSEVVLNVTWAQLQPTQNGPLDTSFIDDAITALTTFNSNNNTNIGIKLRVWGGYTAPDWAKNIDGPPVTITGQSSVDPDIYGPQTIGRVWTADYVAALTSLQNQLAGMYDTKSIIRGISQTAGANTSDEPFVPLSKTAPTSATDPTPINQQAELVSGGYTDAAEALTLRAAIADYAAWSTTPLDYTMNNHYLLQSNGTDDPNFTLAVLQEARNSTRIVQPGNHRLEDPIYSADNFLYAQLAEDSQLDPSAPPASYQTAAPQGLYSENPGSGLSNPYADWPGSIAQGVAHATGDVELWDYAGVSEIGDPTTGALVINPVTGKPVSVNVTDPVTGLSVPVNGFNTLPASQVQALATTLAAGVAPTPGTPLNGVALGFFAPAHISGAAGAIAFTGPNAVLLASAAAQTSYTVTITSTEGGSLAVSSVYQNPAATTGTTVTLTGTPDQVNTELASLTDTPSSGGIDIVSFSATDSSGDSATRNVGVQVVTPATSPGPSGPNVPSALLSNGILAIGGVGTSYSATGNLQIGPTGTATYLLAALSPDAYSTATLSVGGTFEVMSGGTAYFNGSLGAPTVQVDSGGWLAGDGTLATSGGGAITNNSTIEAAADQTLGLEQLTVNNDLTGTGTLQIDAGATLILHGTVSSGQTIHFADNTAAQLANNPYSPSTLTLASPSSMANAITNFTYADQLVLDGVQATGASYAGTTLTVNESGGGTLTFSNFSVSNLSGIQPTFTNDATDNLTTITFVPATTPAPPSAPAPVSQVLVSGTTTTITGQEDAQGSGGVAVSVDAGGALILAGGGVLTAEQEAIVGNAGQGLLELMGGALNATSTSNSLMVGALAGSNGTVLNLEQITAAGEVVVGAAGAGALDVRGDSASVTDDTADVGQSAGSSGTVDVDGGEWTSGTINSPNNGLPQLIVGDAGTGALNISGMAGGITGQVTAYSETIGNRAGGTGTVTLDGGDMLVAEEQATTNKLTVGGSGTGTLSIGNGSEVEVGAALGKMTNLGATYPNTGSLLVGNTAGGTGKVTVTGNSNLLVYGSATVGGGGGAGQVTVGTSADDTALFALVGTLAVNSGGQLALGGANASVLASYINVGAGGQISGAGTLSGDIGGNGTRTSASITNAGTITANGNLLIEGDIAGTGNLAIGANSTMTIQGSVGSGQTLSFGQDSTLVLANPYSFSGTLTNFAIGDTLELGNTNATSATLSGGQLTVDPPPAPIVLNMTGSFPNQVFQLFPDNLGGTNLVLLAQVGSSAPGGWGDVHMTTFDGLEYDFQAVGAFIAVQSTNPGNPWEIEIQTAPLPNATSVTTELAATLGSDRVTIDAGRANTVYVDGAPDSGLHVGTTQILAGGSVAQPSGGVYEIGLNGGEGIEVTDVGGTLNWSVALGPNDGPGSVHGLLGSDTGWATDFQLPDGYLSQTPDSDEILGVFANGWRVSLTRSLLYDPPAPAPPAAPLPPPSPVPFNPTLLVQAIAGTPLSADAAPQDPGATLQNDGPGSVTDPLAASPLHSGSSG